ncbi:uncharacterized protein LOC106880041 [Octopus bimaculoides]|uniref:uncharacterized protein LOC106880041 n=1 Tax=Octopus bimaculoides TaxID=37653 RepID=UPI00071D84B3|nr:uncharacterized protein LOC106880041 [Octopus bimaculoides]|eukprot:XP_014785328.1 PREDICTED: nucleolin 2-like [Octopus bimaculoides]
MADKVGAEVLNPAKELTIHLKRVTPEDIKRKQVTSAEIENEPVAKKVKMEKEKSSHSVTENTKQVLPEKTPDEMPMEVTSEEHVENSEIRESVPSLAGKRLSSENASLNRSNANNLKDDDSLQGTDPVFAEKSVTEGKVIENIATSSPHTEETSQTNMLHTSEKKATKGCEADGSSAESEDLTTDKSSKGNEKTYSSIVKSCKDAAEAIKNAAKAMEKNAGAMLVEEKSTKDNVVTCEEENNGSESSKLVDEETDKHAKVLNKKSANNDDRPADKEDADDNSQFMQKKTACGNLKTVVDVTVSDSAKAVEEESVSDNTKPVEEESVSDNTKPVEEESVSDNTKPVEEESVSDNTKPVEEESVSDNTKPVEEDSVSDNTKPVEEESVSDNTKPVDGKGMDKTKLLDEEGTSDKADSMGEDVSAPADFLFLPTRKMQLKGRCFNTLVDPERITDPRRLAYGKLFPSRIPKVAGTLGPV